jgi:hypothetical protein
VNVIRKEGLCLDVVAAGSDRVVVSTAGADAVSNIKTELMLSFGTKLPWEGGEFIGQYHCVFNVMPNAHNSNYISI